MVSVPGPTQYSTQTVYGASYYSVRTETAFASTSTVTKMYPGEHSSFAVLLDIFAKLYRPCICIYELVDRHGY